MSKKIVAIGGGENGREKNDGTKLPYETGPMDLEIIRLTEKKYPNFLFIGHSQTNKEFEKSYFETMKKIYGDMYGCACKNITREELFNRDEVIKKIKWADIIYEGGGDTDSMMKLWRETGFDKILREAWNNGKVMCGVSAGANCWFTSCSSDSLKIQLNDDNAPMINVEGLGFINAFFTPHCNENCGTTNRLNHMKESLIESNMTGIAMSNCSAIVIVDSKYKIITSDGSNYNINPYGIKGYWKEGKYIEEKLDNNEYKNLDELLSNEIKGEIK